MLVVPFQASGNPLSFNEIVTPMAVPRSTLNIIIAVIAALVVICVLVMIFSSKLRKANRELVKGTVRLKRSTAI